MDIEIEFQLITKPIPVDVTAVRDPGMKSLIVLAGSLGWNIHKKHNQPVVITARNGVQKRLATNTSIRMSVFQTTLSTIMAHTDADVIPTVELIDAIIAITKPSADHQRRLRLAVGETPTEHRERVAAAETVPGGPCEPQPLTTRIELPAAAPAATELEWVEPPESELPNDHGELVSREPFRAVRQVHNGKADTYISDTSFERVWGDGYKDYECQVCGVVFPTPKGVGSHSQIHTRSKGKVTEPAWRRGASTGRVDRVPEPEPVVMRIEKFDVPRDAGAGTILQAVIDLVAPELTKELEELRDEVINLRAERDQLAQNLQALKDLIGGL